MQECLPPGTLPVPSHLDEHTAASYPESLRSFTKVNLMQLALHGPALINDRSISFIESMTEWTADWRSISCSSKMRLWNCNNTVNTFKLHLAFKGMQKKTIKGISSGWGKTKRASAEQTDCRDTIERENCAGMDHDHIILNQIYNWLIHKIHTEHRQA